MITRSSQEVLSSVPNSSDQGCGLNGGGRRKRKRSGFHNAKTASPDLECRGSKEPNAFQELFAVPAPPAPKVLCRRKGNVSQRCNAVTSRAWAPGRGGWMEPVGHGPALNQTQGPWPLCLVGAKDDCPSTSRPKATKRHRKARLEKLYVKGPLLGKGGYGSVYAGTRKSDGMLVAIKYVSKAQAEEELDIPGQEGPLPLEVALMKQVNVAPQCPYIMQLLEWFDQPSRYIMVLERPEPCQDLIAFCQDRGGTMSEGLARQVMVQLLRALNHCSERGVLHRDIKPENLLIQTDSQHVKLFDFGCGDLLKNTAYKDFAGTLEYTPPEWFLHRQYLAGPATVWSVGITLYNLICGFLPFSTIRETIKGRVRFTKGLSPECRQLIRWCLSTKAVDRPTMEQIQLHPWLL
ncbi:serine/threonine-protein kinase pim-3-like [Oncorhynchus nerka]|uniref:serine/threonine-protein kinase pim-3-like n=1 Tax=Oncorhynchus nerka TaxID=8023 RepID=UPI001130ABE4|nr:serine/threonine-protein kinase pim-3-like [Oncorhynchus nerka]